MYAINTHMLTQSHDHHLQCVCGGCVCDSTGVSLSGSHQQLLPELGALGAMCSGQGSGAAARPGMACADLGLGLCAPTVGDLHQRGRWGHGEG